MFTDIVSLRGVDDPKVAWENLRRQPHPMCMSGPVSVINSSSCATVSWWYPFHCIQRAQYISISSLYLPLIECCKMSKEWSVTLFADIRKYNGIIVSRNLDQIRGDIA